MNIPSSLRRYPSVLLLSASAWIGGNAFAQDAPATKLAPVLQSFVEKHIAPGVVALVANKDGVLALERAGYASLANKTPIRENAVFWIALMSKSLTGTALMMLVMKTVGKFGAAKVAH